MLYIIASLEFILLLLGTTVLRTSKIPEWAINKKYKAEGKSIQKLGFLMIFPSVIGFVLGFFIGYKSFGSNTGNYALIAVTIQIAVMIIVFFISTIVIVENLKPNKTNNISMKSPQE